MIQEVEAKLRVRLALPPAHERQVLGHQTSLQAGIKTPRLEHNKKSNVDRFLP